MGRRIDNYHKKLLGKYPDLTQKQIDYILIMTDPATKIRQLTQGDIADALGVDRLTINRWWNTKKIREIINNENKLKAVDRLPEVIKVVEDIIFKKEEPTSGDKIRLDAVAKWGQFHGITEEAKQKVTEKTRTGNKTYEDILREAEEALGDDVEDADS